MPGPFIEERLLDEVSYGFQAGPGFKTLINTRRDGKERRKSLQSIPLYRFTAPYGGLRPDSHALVIEVFNACLGPGYGFRFKDWSDYQAVNMALGNTPGANTTPVQLAKSYSKGGLTTVRPIFKPVAGTVTVQQGDGSGGWTTVAGTLDTTTGLFTPDSAWTAGRPLRWSGEFDVPVRFASDELIFTYANPNKLTADVQLVEDRGV